MKMESSFFVSAKDDEEVVDHQWDGYTLLLPCVSVGNVPQLACDLLVSSLLKKTSSTSDQSDPKDLELVGYIRSSSVRPFAGPDPYSLQGPLLATSIQVFVSKAKKLVLIQQRSPIFKEFRTEFYNELSAWLSKHCFSLILLLSSSFDQYLAPAEKEKSSFPTKYLLGGDGGAKALSTGTKAFLEETLKVTAIEPSVDLYSKTAKPVAGDEQQQQLKPPKSGLRIHLPGSGSARAYLSTLGASAEASTTTELLCLVMFCSEGDNRQHAFKLADTVAHLVNHKQAGAFAKQGKGGNEFTWTVPFSWRTLFGDEPPAEIF